MEALGRRVGPSQSASESLLDGVREHPRTAGNQREERAMSELNEREGRGNVLAGTLQLGASSSTEEHPAYTGEVAGSIPASPTRKS